MVSSGDSLGEGFGSFRKVPSVIGYGEGLGEDLGGSWEGLGEGLGGTWRGLGLGRAWVDPGKAGRRWLNDLGWGWR